MTRTDAGATVMHVRIPGRVPEPHYRSVVELLTALSPVVQAVPPGAAVVELRGALRYFEVPAVQLAEQARLRSVALLGVDLRVGLGPTWTVAATASAQVPEHGGIVSVEPGRVGAFLGPVPVEALDGIGSVQAKGSRRFGVVTAGGLASLPLSTVQRILGGSAGRLVFDRARGVDLRPVTPRRMRLSVAVRHRFARQELDSGAARARPLDLVVELAATLRSRDQIARGLTLRLDFATGPPWSRTLRLPEPSAHNEDLRVAVYRLMDRAGLQLGRLTGILLRAEDLACA
ncbi:hypothetical protein AB0C59_32210 [Streptomyces sp. NPDC048664]|uniref:DNA polymerase Y family protein n=1 Tax=Streptomyces sp. NPDC048664 TaxID=3154505 RepID=UPI00342908C1